MKVRSTGVRRTSLEAELFEQRRKPVDHAGRAQTTATSGAHDRPRWFAYPQQASERTAQVRMHGDAPTATLLGDRVVDRKTVGDLAARIEDHWPLELGDLAGAQSRFDRQEDHHSITGREWCNRRSAQHPPQHLVRNDLGLLAGHDQNSFGWRCPKGARASQPQAPEWLLSVATNSDETR
jgi:hypothetical protein